MGYVRKYDIEKLVRENIKNLFSEIELKEKRFSIHKLLHESYSFDCVLDCRVQTLLAPFYYFLANLLESVMFEEFHIVDRIAFDIVARYVTILEYEAYNLDKYFTLVLEKDTHRLLVNELVEKCKERNIYVEVEEEQRFIIVRLFDRENALTKFLEYVEKNFSDIFKEMNQLERRLYGILKVYAKMNYNRSFLKHMCTMLINEFFREEVILVYYRTKENVELVRKILQHRDKEVLSYLRQTLSI